MKGVDAVHVGVAEGFGERFLAYGHVRLDEAGCREGDGEAVLLEEGACELCRVEPHALAGALQVKRLAVATTAEAQTESPRQIVAQVAPERTLPSVVVVARAVAFQVAVTPASVDEERKTLGDSPVAVEVEREFLGVEDVAVGIVKHTVFDETIIYEPVVGNAVTERGIHAKFRGEVAVGKGHIVAMLTVKVRVAVGDGLGIALIYVRREIGDARAADTHIVRSLEHLQVRDVVAQDDVGHEVAEIAGETGTRMVGITHVHL